MVVTLSGAPSVHRGCPEVGAARPGRPGAIGRELGRPGDAQVSDADDLVAHLEKVCHPLCCLSCHRSSSDVVVGEQVAYRLADQASLADAGLAVDEHDGRLARTGGSHRRLELGQLGSTSNQADRPRADHASMMRVPVNVFYLAAA